MKKLTQIGDQLAVSLSLICAIHCFAGPIIIALLPSFQILSCSNNESVHYWMMFGILPSSLISLGMGCRKHKKLNFLLMGLIGLTVLTIASIWGHQLLGCKYEKYLTLLGSCIIAFAHVNNYLLCRKADCNTYQAHRMEPCSHNLK